MLGQDFDLICKCVAALNHLCIVLLKKEDYTFFFQTLVVAVKTIYDVQLEPKIADHRRSYSNSKCLWNDIPHNWMHDYVLCPCSQEYKQTTVYQQQGKSKINFGWHRNLTLGRNRRKIWSAREAIYPKMEKSWTWFRPIFHRPMVGRLEVLVCWCFDLWSFRQQSCWRWVFTPISLLSSKKNSTCPIFSKLNTIFSIIFSILFKGKFIQSKSKFFIFSREFFVSLLWNSLYIFVSIDRL